MYVVLFLMAGLIFWAGTILGQHVSNFVVVDSSDKEDRLNMREEIHRRIMKKLLYGSGPDQDMFSDLEQMMDTMMKDSFSHFDTMNFGQMNSPYSMEWSENQNGRTLSITPKNKDQQLDINIENKMITISGRAELKTQNGVSYSQFKNATNVPSDCDSSKVKMDHKDNTILVFFPFHGQQSKKSQTPLNDRKPLPPSDLDVEI